MVGTCQVPRFEVEHGKENKVIETPPLLHERVANVEGIIYVKSINQSNCTL